MILTARKQTEAERYLLFKQMDSARNRFVSFARQQFGSALNKQFNMIIDAFQDRQDLSLTIFARYNPMLDAYLKVYQEVGVSFAKRTLTTLETDRALKQESNQVDLWLNFMRDFTLTKAGERIANVSLNSLDIVRKVMNEGIEEGLGVQEIARNMRKKWTDLSRYRSELIARTEVVGASNRGSLLGAESTGLDLKKSWLSTRDNRTRDAHFAADGQVVGLHENFIVGGESLAYPGDPSGSGGNVIACFPGDQLTKVNPKNLKRIFRSVYKGQVITVKTTSGKSFTCTPNHPILTTQGWVKAMHLTKRHNLIKSDFIESLTKNFNIENGPATFEKIYNSFLVPRMLMRMRRVHVNFYGDIPASDVDVINIERKLMNREKSVTRDFLNSLSLKFAALGKSFLFGFAAISKHFFKCLFRQFSHHLISFFSDILALLNSSIFKPDNISLRTVPNTKPFPFYNSINRCSGNIETFGKGKDAFSGFVSFDKPVNINSSLSVPIFMPYSIVNKNLPKPVIVNAENITEFFDADTFGIHSDGVAFIDSSWFHDYVYTFETDNQMYDINSFVARNCRCTQTYVT